MNFFITLTTDCDLKCRYCYGECCDDFDSADDRHDIDYFIPRKVSYDTDSLKKFIEQDPNATVIFYGGEPLLQADRMTEFMDELPAKRFLLHTNGTLLDRVPVDYLRRLHTISISIDGDEALTDYYRGKGVYRKIMNNSRTAIEKGFEGETIARMTVTEATDIKYQAPYLLKNPDHCFDSVHWQLNALFWHNDYRRRNFAEWATNSYDPGIRAMILEWVRVMKDEGRVLRMYPFMSVMRSLLTDEKTLLRCGAGWAEFNVQTDGNLSPCPVMSGMRDYYAGNILTSRPLDLKRTLIGGPCNVCDIKEICGGRCLYANVTMKWGEKGFKEVCSTIRNLICALQAAKPEISRLIDDGIVSMEDFDHLRYNSCEIIP